ncbi:MAG: L-rhamnose mutarotase [Bacteroidetes bacterium]|nr:L-rhamnose mutarotase [Bacteroidota bacterium]
MQRIAFTMKLHAGFEEEYRRRHDEIWPELAALLRETGVREYSIFLDEVSLVLFGVLLIEEPVRLDELPVHPVMQKWWNYMKDIMDSNPNGSPVTKSLKEVFYLP